MEKWRLFDQSYGLTSLEKCQFSGFRFYQDFYSLERHFFVLDYRETPFHRIFFPKGKRWENFYFFDPNQRKVKRQKRKKFRL